MGAHRSAVIASGRDGKFRKGFTLANQKNGR